MIDIPIETAYHPTEPYMTFGPGYENWTEKQFQRAITHELAGYFGWTRSYHNLYAVGSDTGFPDLVLVNPGRPYGVLYLEVKGGKKSKVGPDQELWMADLQSAWQHAYIVYPEDLMLVQGLLKGDFAHPYIASGKGFPPRIVIDERLMALRYYRERQP